MGFPEFGSSLGDAGPPLEAITWAAATLTDSRPAALGVSSALGGQGSPNNTPRRSLNNRHVLSHRSGGRRAPIKMPEKVVFGEDSSWRADGHRLAWPVLCAREERSWWLFFV